MRTRVADSILEVRSCDCGDVVQRLPNSQVRASRLRKTRSDLSHTYPSIVVVVGTAVATGVFYALFEKPSFWLRERLCPAAARGQLPPK